MGYEYEILYRLGKENGWCLVPKNGVPKLQAITMPRFQIWNDIRELNQSNSYMLQILEKKKQDSGQMKHFVSRDGIHFYKGMVLIPPDSQRKKLLHEFDNTKSGGHSGMLHTYKRLAQSCYWEAIRKAIRLRCSLWYLLKNKSDACSLAGLL